MEVCRQQGCYKVILDCSEANQAFYEKCGLTRKEVQMVSLHTSQHCSRAQSSAGSLHADSACCTCHLQSSLSSRG